MTAFSLQTLGFPEIHADDRPIKLDLRKGLALLIYLAEAQGRRCARRHCDAAVARESRETGRARLRRMLHRIELTLGQQVFETDRTSVRWSPAVELKVNSHLFERACDRGDVRGGLPALSRRLPRGLLAGATVRSSTIGRSFAARRCGGG